MYSFSIALIIFFSLYLNDSKIAVLSAFFGISYTIFAGRGKIYCYFFGIISSLLYSYLSFKNGIYGNFILNFCYYLPAQIIGVFLWKKNLKKNSLEIIKTKLNYKKRGLFFIGATILSIVAGLILKNFGNLPYLDGICLIFSIFAMVLTVKRCIEQWYFWIIVNFTSVLLWLFVYLKNSNCIATLLMWLVYLILGFYFLKRWKKELQ